MWWTTELISTIKEVKEQFASEPIGKPFFFANCLTYLLLLVLKCLLDSRNLWDKFSHWSQGETNIADRDPSHTGDMLTFFIMLLWNTYSYSIKTVLYL